MRITVHPRYEYLRTWIADLPRTFAVSGEVIYDGRNQLRRIFVPSSFSTDSLPLVVKQFHRPALPNRFIYTYLREPKASRAYRNALYLQQQGIGTPEAIAYVLCGKGLLAESYLVTRESRLPHLMREFTINYTPALDELIRPFARFTARMHEAGILHLDYSPGNILWDKNPDYGKGDSAAEPYVFEVIDINRMRVGRKVTLREGCESMRRICARRSFFDVFADEYALIRGYDKTECSRWIHYYRDLFWNHGRKAQYEYN